MNHIFFTNSHVFTNIIPTKPRPTYSSYESRLEKDEHGGTT